MIVVISKAPAITNARLGSQSPVTSRKARILLGFIIPDTPRPTPKRTPDIEDIIILFIFLKCHVTNEIDGDCPG